MPYIIQEWIRERREWLPVKKYKVHTCIIINY